MTNEAIKISVLLPTRGRPREFARAVDSLLTTAAKPSAIQVLAYVDNDDPSLAEYPSSVVVGPRYGYPRLYEAIANHLIPLAKGVRSPSPPTPLPRSTGGEGSARRRF